MSNQNTTHTDFGLPISVRLNRPLAADVRAIANRDCNGISATIRRLLTQAVALDRRNTNSEGSR